MWSLNPLILSSILLLPLPFATSQTTTIEPHFINPPKPGDVGNYSENLQWPYGSTQTLQWVADFADYELYVFQDNHVANGSPKLLTTGTATVQTPSNITFTWEVMTVLNYISVPPFWFIVYETTPGGENRTISSHYFNITSATTSSSSSSSSSSSMTSASAKGASSQTSTPSTSTTPTPSPSGSSGLSTGAKIGIGVAIPLLAIAAIAIGAVFFLRRRKNNHGQQTYAAASTGQMQGVPVYQEQQMEYQDPGYKPVGLHEVAAPHGTSELPSEGHVQRYELGGG